jgi:hypothetical protein
MHTLVAFAPRLVRLHVLSEIAAGWGEQRDGGEDQSGAVAIEQSEEASKVAAPRRRRETYWNRFLRYNGAGGNCPTPTDSMWLIQKAFEERGSA